MKGLKPEGIINLTSLLNESGEIEWDVPEGSWKILRFGAANNGSVTRPAPDPGLGFESDKFDTVGLKNHLKVFPGVLLNQLGKTDSQSYGGLKMLHMDSWEMGAQNWTKTFVNEFIQRRGYDPTPYFPVIAGFPVVNEEVSERFLWIGESQGRSWFLKTMQLLLKSMEGHTV